MMSRDVYQSVIDYLMGNYKDKITSALEGGIPNINFIFDDNEEYSINVTKKRVKIFKREYSYTSNIFKGTHNIYDDRILLFENINISEDDYNKFNEIIEEYNLHKIKLSEYNRNTEYGKNVLHLIHKLTESKDE